MAKKDKKKADKSDEKELAKQAKAEAKRWKQQEKDARKAEKGSGAAGEQAALAPAAQAAPAAEQQGDASAPAGSPGQVDQVGVLKLALRDTEAKLVAAEHRLHQVQQQLDDERRALAEATGSTLAEQEAVVDAAVAETVAEAVVAAELAAVVGAEADPVEVVATTLEDAAEVLDAVLADEAPFEGTQADGAVSQADAEARQDAEAAFTGARSDLTPPLPEHGSDEGPNETWTLVHLRKEAERRGITGVSNLTKAALIERLRG